MGSLMFMLGKKKTFPRHYIALPLFSRRMRIALTDYGSLEEVLRAVRDLPYEGGSRRTGDALRFLVDHVFSPVISRDHAPKVRGVSRRDVKILSGCLCIYLSLSHSRTHADAEAQEKKVALYQPQKAGLDLLWLISALKMLHSFKRREIF